MNNVAEAWYALAHLRGIGPKTLHALREALGSEHSEMVVEVAAGDLRRVSGMRKANLERLVEAFRQPVTELDPSYEVLVNSGVEIIHLGHDLYPPNLVDGLGREAPPILYCSGYLPLLVARSVAIVGARHATPDALGYAAQLAAEFSGLGLNVVSGFATGIDASAHSSALAADGTTTFVLSSGLCDSSVRRGLSELGESRSSLALSQFEPNEPWRARNAMARNKTVCALADAVVVIQSGVERDATGKLSGSFDAAKAALSMRLPLFVVAPDAFESIPAGNQRLLELGANAIDPRSNGAALVVHALTARSQDKTDPEQLRLLA